jgi:Pyruvate/2-oxoacid:ferredoxin oxidoreductase delta subunit
LDEHSKVEQDLDCIYCSRLVPGEIDMSKPLPKGIFSCIGSLSPYSLLEWMIRSWESVKVITGVCHQCEMKRGLLNFERVRNEILSALSLFKIPVAPVTIHQGTDLDKKEAGKRYLAYKADQDKKTHLRRRDFLLGFHSQFSPEGREKRTTGMQQDDSRLTERRVPAWLRTMIALFKDNRKTFFEEDKVSFFSEMEIEDSCMGCGICAILCPTGALQTKTTEKDLHLEWTPSHCSGCDICREVCSKHSIQFFQGLPVRKIYKESNSIIKSFHRNHCPECHQEFISFDFEGSCPYCQKQRELIQDYARTLYGETGKTFFKNE